MDKEIEFFIITLSHIGGRDDSLYDTQVKDSIRGKIIEQPLSKDAAFTSAFELSERAETEKLIDALRSLLMAFEASPADQSLESAIKGYVLRLSPDSKQRALVDEIFGDYFDESAEGNRELPAPIRNFFYSDKCYVALTFVPAIIVGLVMFAVTPHTYLYRFATLIFCFIVFLGGDRLYNYLNARIQRYEREVQPRST